MGLEDLSLFRSIPNSTILYPSDAVSCSKLVNLSTSLSNIKYIRTTRSSLPIIYDKYESFRIGNFKVLKESNQDSIVLLGAGITLHESMKAYNMLKEKGISSSVLDLYCIKPLDFQKLSDFIIKHGKKLVITEDHYEQGGIGEMLSEVFANAQANTKIKALSIDKVPHSGKTSELLALHKINWEAIYSEAKSL